MKNFKFSLRKSHIIKLIKSLTHFIYLVYQIVSPIAQKNEVFYQFSADLATITEEILNGKPHFLCSVQYKFKLILYQKIY